MGKDVEGELDALAGETSALQVIMIGVCRTMPKDALRAAFEHVDTVLERAALRLGDRAREGHVRHALRVAEEIREAVLSDDDEGPQEERKA